MNALADTDVASRRRDLDAGFTEFFLNGKLEIAPARRGRNASSPPHFTESA
jgi:hypothetical protein